MRSYDAIIVGGGIIGLATGYYLTRRKKKVLVIEKNYLGAGSTGRCIGGIRQQFSSPGSILVAMESVRLFKEMDKEFGFSVEWHQGGYLFLAYDEETKEKYLKAIEIQRKFGLKVYFIDAKEVEKIVPHLNMEGVIGGAYSPEDGQAYPFAVLRGYAEGIKKAGSEILTRRKVVKVLAKNMRVEGVEVDTGEKFYAPIVLNAAGPWAKEVAKTVDLELPLYPERHEALVTERLPKFFEPMIVDYRPDGCYFQQRPNGQIIGCYTPIPNVPGTRVDSSFEFLYEMGFRMARLIPVLKYASIVRQWAGSYTMTPDGNPIVDVTDIEGFYVASGMSGHGFMFGPGIGKYLAKHMVDGVWEIDMSEFSLKRDFGRKELMK